MPYVKTADGTMLHVNDGGTGSPIVLFHGWPLDADMWEYNACPLVQAGHRVIAYDRRAFGRSGQPWTGYDYDTLTDDRSAVIAAHDVRGATLVGFSMGGGEVARYLGGRGDASRVSKAVFVSAVCPYLLKSADNPEGVDQSVFDAMVAGLRNRARLVESKNEFYRGLTDGSQNGSVWQNVTRHRAEECDENTIGAQGEHPVAGSLDFPSTFEWTLYRPGVWSRRLDARGAPRTRSSHSRAGLAALQLRPPYDQPTPELMTL